MGKILSQLISFIEDQKEIIFNVNGNEKTIQLKNMEKIIRVGNVEVNLEFQEDAPSEALEDSLVTPLR
ncbi:hypothetical protein RclHR1_16340004 [Rhizophagus clarus]|uniref:Uncharacterized protein n=1 Tax=Rhizophagus clarus TaxID=94130 RepID=A0A2Z6RA63_9GLOM|nr:hypothetical protein RclHR1_16340004 [Rhizophagus clarus]GES96294.1 hypothetical protein RCL_jg1897.t1 [Rhizophagus clarus]